MVIKANDYVFGGYTDIPYYTNNQSYAFIKGDGQKSFVFSLRDPIQNLKSEYR